MTGPAAPIEDLAQAFIVADGVPGARLFKGAAIVQDVRGPGADSGLPTAHAIGSGSARFGSGARNVALLVGIGIIGLLLVGGLVAFASGGGPAHHATSRPSAIGTVPRSPTTTPTESGTGGSQIIACAPGALCSTTTSKPCVGVANCATTTTHACNAATPGCPTRTPGAGQTTTTNPCPVAAGGCGNVTTTTTCGSPVVGCTTTSITPQQGTTTTGAPTTTSTAPSCLTVISVSPNQGAPGQAVTVTGCGFTNATGVTFGPSNSAVFSVNTDTSITATVPANPGAPGPVDVQVTTPFGTTAAVAADRYTYI